MFVNINECEAAGLDPNEVDRIAKGLSRYANQAKSLGITVFGGSGMGQLHFDDTGAGWGSLIIADLHGRFDGGDGATHEDENGLTRSETI